MFYHYIFIQLNLVFVLTFPWHVHIVHVFCFHGVILQFSSVFSFLWCFVFTETSILYSMSDYLVAAIYPRCLSVLPPSKNTPNNHLRSNVKLTVKGSALTE